jgi:hypothetical protein
VRKRVGTSFSFSDIVAKSNAAEVRHFYHSFLSKGYLKKNMGMAFEKQFLRHPGLNITNFVGLRAFAFFNTL